MSDDGVTGHLVFGRFHFSGKGVYQELGQRLRNPFFSAVNQKLPRRWEYR
jgi:hypothetical protein